MILSQITKQKHAKQPNSITETKMKKPSFKMVLTAVGQYAYMRTDGVMVVPIGCLKD